MSTTIIYIILKLICGLGNDSVNDLIIHLGIVGPVSKTTRSNLVNTSELVLDGFQISPPPECPPPCQTFLLSAVQKSKPRKVLGANILKIYFEVCFQGFKGIRK